MAERNPKTVFIMGTAREDTSILLSRMSTAAIGNVILYNAPEARLGHAQAEEFVQELEIINKNTTFSTSADLSDIQQSDIIIAWGYNFVPARDENLVAVRKLFKSVIDAIDVDDKKTEVFLFPDNLNGLINANLFHSLITESEILDEDTLDIKVISSIATSGVAVFGSSGESASAWPSVDGFFVEAGINDDNHSKLEFYRDCCQENKRPHFSEAVAMADFVKLLSMSRNENELKQHVHNKMKIIGRLTGESEVEKLGIENSSILFLPVSAEGTGELSEAVVEIIRRTEAEVKKAIKYL